MRYWTPPESSVVPGAQLAVIGGISGVDPPGPLPVGGAWFSFVVTCTTVESAVSYEQTANAVVVTPNASSAPMIPPTTVHEPGFVAPSATATPAALLGKLAIGLKL